jgi:serine phosphatase RsbU (regulator of sigma subunit)
VTSEEQFGSNPFALFMRQSHLVATQDIPAYVSEHAAALGFPGALVYLVDLQQQVLVPFPPSGVRAGEQPSVLSVDSTLAGRAYQQVEILLQDNGPGPARVWMPLLDGTERIGVLSSFLEPPGELRDEQRDRLRFFASLVAQLVATKTLYGDLLVRLRRTAPMGLAAEIQWSLLPPLTFANQDVSVAAALEPAYEVAGDSVDYAVDGDAARFGIFDGMGHGLVSAQLVSLAVAAYRNARRAGRTLTETSRQIEDSVTAVFQGEGFITALLGELETSTGVFRWVSAGHPPPLLLRHGRLVKTLELDANLPFGLGLEGPVPAGPGDPGLRIGSEQLEPGDYLLLYTDGVTEARSPEGELFGVHRLTDLMIRNLAAGLPASETMRRAVTALLEHQGSELADDATMLLAHWRPEQAEVRLP